MPTTGVAGQQATPNAIRAMRHARYRRSNAGQLCAEQQLPHQRRDEQ